MKNTLKNLTITALVAVIAFMALADGTGAISLQQMGIPVFIMVFGVLISMMVEGKDNE